MVEQSDLSQTRLDVAFAVKELYYGAAVGPRLRRLGTAREQGTGPYRAEELDDSALSASSRYKLRLAQLDLAVAAARGRRPS